MPYDAGERLSEWAMVNSNFARSRGWEVLSLKEGIIICRLRWTSSDNKLTMMQWAASAIEEAAFKAIQAFQGLEKGHAN